MLPFLKYFQALPGIETYTNNSTTAYLPHHLHTSARPHSLEGSVLHNHTSHVNQTAAADRQAATDSDIITTDEGEGEEDERPASQSGE